MHACLNVCMQVRTFVGVSVYVKVYDSITHWLSCMFIYPCKKLCPLVPGYRVSNATRSLKSRPSKFQLSGKQPDDITDLYIFFKHVGLSMFHQFHVRLKCLGVPCVRWHTGGLARLEKLEICDALRTPKTVFAFV